MPRSTWTELDLQKLKHSVSLGYSVDEIAKILKRSKGAIYNKVHREGLSIREAKAEIKGNEELLATLQEPVVINREPKYRGQTPLLNEEPGFFKLIAGKLLNIKWTQIQ